MGKLGIHVAINQMAQAYEAIDKAVCALDSFRAHPDSKLLDIAVDYLKEAGGKHLYQADKFLTLYLSELQSCKAVKTGKKRKESEQPPLERAQK